MTDTKTKIPDLSRRNALKRLGLAVGAAYMTPTLLSLSNAHASSGSSGGSGASNSGASNSGASNSMPSNSMPSNSMPSNSTPSASGLSSSDAAGPTLLQTLFGGGG